jgi:hypothetical protein
MTMFCAAAQVADNAAMKIHVRVFMVVTERRGTESMDCGSLLPLWPGQPAVAADVAVD